MNGITFIAPGNPLSQNSVYKRGRGRRLYMTDEGRAWKSLLYHIAMLSLGFHDSVWEQDGEKDVQLVYYFSSRRPDCDGPTKLILDAMQGVLYHNDRQVRDITLRKRLDKENPRVEITVWQSSWATPENKK